MPLAWFATAPIEFSHVRAFSPGDYVPDSIVARFNLSAKGKVEQREVSYDPPGYNVALSPLLRGDVDSDEEREALVPSRLSEGALRAALAPVSALGQAQRVSDIRRGKGGVIGTGGRGVIAIRIDHQLDAFRATFQPLLVARALPWGIGVVTKSVGNPSAPYEPTTTTWAQIKTDVLNAGGEVWAHSQTHSDGDPAYGGTSIKDEIVGSKADLEAQGIRVMGWQQPGGPATYEHHSPADLDDEAGRLIRDTYGLWESYMPGTAYRPLPTNGCFGFDHYTLDQRTLAQARTIVDRAAEYQIGIELMFHPDSIGDPGFMSVADFTALLDYIATRRDAGAIEVLTPSGLAFADPDSDRRVSLVTNGDFEDVTSATVPFGWATDTASWTINTDGGRSGSRYLHVPTAQTLITARSPISSLGMDGFTFMFEGWVRSRDAGGATWRVSISSRGATNTAVVNKTAAIAQGASWARVLFPFTMPVLDTSDITVSIGRLSGGSVDWDDVSVRPV